MVISDSWQQFAIKACVGNVAWVHTDPYVICMYPGQPCGPTRKASIVMMMFYDAVSYCVDKEHCIELLS